jgi:hypothetical protein
MLQGIAPYKLAYNMKFPGTYAAMMSIFGQTIIGINLRTKSKKNPSVVLLCESRDMRDVRCASNLKTRTKSAKERLLVAQCLRVTHHWPGNAISAVR